MESGGGQMRGGGFVAGGNGVEVGERGERVREGGQGVARAVWAVCGSSVHRPCSQPVSSMYCLTDAG